MCVCERALILWRRWFFDHDSRVK